MDTQKVLHVPLYCRLVLLSADRRAAVGGSVGRVNVRHFLSQMGGGESDTLFEILLLRNNVPVAGEHGSDHPK